MKIRKGWREFQSLQFLLLLSVVFPSPLCFRSVSPPGLLYSSITPRSMPGKHIDREGESWRGSDMEGESLFGRTTDQIQLFSDSGMLCYETGKLPPHPPFSLDGCGQSDRIHHLYFTLHTRNHAYLLHCIFTCIHTKINFWSTESHKVQPTPTHTVAFCGISSGVGTLSTSSRKHWMHVWKLSKPLPQSLLGFNVTQCPEVKWPSPPRSWQKCQTVLTWVFISLYAADTQDCQSRRVSWVNSHKRWHFFIFFIRY